MNTIALRGIFSLIHIFLFPGVFIYRNEGFKRNLIIPSSLLYNYFIIIVLVLVHAYNLSSIVILDLIFFVFIKFFLKKRNTNKMKNIEVAHKASWLNLGIFYCLLLFLFAKYLKSIWVFDSWDAVASWNPWAKYWFQGMVPTNTWEYPQMIPILYSFTYKIIGNSQVQLFAKALMGLFDLLSVIFVFNFLNQKESLKKYSGFGVLLFYYLLRNFTFLFSGYVDGAVVFLSILLVIYIDHLEESEDRFNNRNDWWTPLLILSSILLTKGSPLYLIIIFPFLFREKISRSTLLKIGMGLIFLVGSWYFYRVYLISTGVTSSAAKGVLGATNVVPVWKRPFLIFNYLPFENLWPIGLTFLSICYFGIKDLRYKKISLMIVGNFLTWSFFASYDGRNFASAIFPLTYLFLVGFDSVVDVKFQMKKDIFLNNSRDVFICFNKRNLLIVFVIILLVSSFVSDDKILSYTNYKILKVGNFEINKKLEEVLKTETKFSNTDSFLRANDKFSSKEVFFHCNGKETLNRINEMLLNNFQVVSSHCDEGFKNKFKEFELANKVILIKTSENESIYKLR